MSRGTNSPTVRRVPRATRGLNGVRDLERASLLFRDTQGAVSVIAYYKASPTEYVILHRKGATKRKGKGLGFFYQSHGSHIVSVPLSAIEADFDLSETTLDFQTMHMKGQAVFWITDPATAASKFDFSVNPKTRRHLTDEPERMKQLVVNLVHDSIRADVQRLKLEDALRKRALLSKAALSRLKQRAELEVIGVEVVSVFIASAKPTPEVAKALEAGYRETLVAKANMARTNRRTAAVARPGGVDDHADELDGIECNDMCPFAAVCEDYRKHVHGGKAWCTLFQEFSR